MGEFDNESYELGSDILLTPTPTTFDFEVDQEMEDHDLVFHHVAQGDAELYAMDCCMADLMRV